MNITPMVTCVHHAQVTSCGIASTSAGITFGIIIGLVAMALALAVYRLMFGFDPKP